MTEASRPCAIGTCGTCRWWERFHYEAHNVQTAKEQGVCVLTKTNGSQGDVYPKSLAKAQDAEYYSASLVTESTFGCVQWRTQPEGTT